MWTKRGLFRPGICGADPQAETVKLSPLKNASTLNMGIVHEDGPSKLNFVIDAIDLFIYGSFGGYRPRS